MIPAEGIVTDLTIHMLWVGLIGLGVVAVLSALATFLALRDFTNQDERGFRR